MSTQTGNYPEDKDLVNHVLRGDHAAFARIIKNTEALVAAIVYKMIPNQEDRKDIAQDVYLKAFHKLAGFKFQCKLSTWMGQIAYNTCLSWLEKKKLVLPQGPYGDNDSNEDPLDCSSPFPALALQARSKLSVDGSYARPSTSFFFERKV